MENSPYIEVEIIEDLDKNENTKDSAVNGSFDSEKNKMEIQEIYKQPLVLCSTCGTLISYKTSLEENYDGAGLFSSL